MATQIYYEAPSLPLPAQERSGFIQTQLRRMANLRAVAGGLGLGNTLKIVWDAKARQGSVERPIAFSLPAGPEHSINMTTALSDISTYLEIFQRQVYELPPSLAERVAGRPIVDIGANIGLSAVYFANRYPNSEITAIEPNDRNFNLLAVNTLQYGNQIDAVNAAVTSQQGPVGFRRTPDSPPTNHVAYAYEVGYGDQGEHQVRGITPEEIYFGLGAKGNIGILKVDIEGAEKSLFESGAADELLARTEVLLVETHDQFAPGSSHAVKTAAARGGLSPAAYDNGHTTVYTRG